MPLNKITRVLCALAAIVCCTSMALAQNGKEAAKAKGVQRCGLFLRTDFGHYEKLGEMSVEPDTALTNGIESGRVAEIVDAFESYLSEVDKKFGDSEHRDVIRTRTCQVFKSVENDSARAKQLIAAFREFTFASTLEMKGLKERSIEQVRKSRNSFLKAVPADSFCIMPVDLYLATTLAENGSATEAVSIAQSVVSRASKSFGKRDEFTGSALIALGRAYLKAGNASRAEQALREGIDIASESLELQPTVYLLNCSLLAETLLEEKKYPEAADLMEYLEPQIRKLFNDHLEPPVLNAIMMRSKALVGMNRLNEAEKALGRYPEIVQSLREPGVEGRNLLEVAAELLDSTGKTEKAAAYKKWIARYDSKHENTTKR